MKHITPQTADTARLLLTLACIAIVIALACRAVATTFARQSAEQAPAVLILTVEQAEPALAEPALTLVTEYDR